MAIKRFFHKAILSVFFFIFFFSLVILPASAEENLRRVEKNDRKQLVTSDYVYDIAVSGGYLWQGINGGLILRSLSASQVYRHYHKLNSGLKGNHVYTAVPDGKGGVWLGTESGAAYLSSRGGWIYYNTDNSPLTVNDVQVIHPDNKGGVWFGTWRGGAYYLGADNHWKTYNTANSPLPGNRIYAITTDDQGGTWFGVDGRGAAYLSAGGEWRLFNAAGSGLPVNDVLEIVVDNEGSVWFATYNGLACLDTSGEWIIYSTGNSELPADLISALTLSEDGSVWVGAGGALVRMVGREVKEVFTSNNSTLSGDVIKSLDTDESGRVWAGTWGSGVACLTPSFGTFTIYNAQTTEMPGKIGLPSNSIYTVYPFSAEGAETVWFGTDKGAVSLDLRSSLWKSYPLAAQKGGDPAHVRRIARSQNGSLVFALDCGLAVMDRQGSLAHYREEDSDLPSDDVIDAVFDGAGGVWIATMGDGAAYLSPSGQWTLYNTENSPLPSDYLNCVLVSSGGQVWFGTWGEGVAVYDSRKEKWQVYNTANSKLPLDDIRCLLEDSSGGIWFGSWGAGLARLETSGSWTFYSEESGLPSSIIHSLTRDPAGKIWAATPAGAAYFNGSVWKKLSAAETGLPVDNLWQVSCDEGGNVWFATGDSGVAVYNSQGLTSAVREITDLAQNHEEIILYIDKKILHPDVAPLMKEARVLVPLRIISESLGAKVNWESSTGKIEVELDGKKIELTAGSTEVLADGVHKNLDVPPLFAGGRTLVPLRFVSENLGLKVQWDGVVRAVLITKGQQK